MKLLLDMNIPVKFTSLFKQKGFEVLRWSDIGKPNATDKEIIAYARDNEFIVVTYDLDFSAILSASHDLKPSIVQVRTTLHQAAKIVDLVATAIWQNKDNLIRGAILTIDSKRARFRMLPL